MEKLVSVIVPVYNVKLYLKRCMDSLLQQDYKNIEILVVDDGSTDGSAAMCDTYASEKRIKVWHQKNKGQSAARNFALDKVRGDYILFVDADDYVAKEILSATVPVLEQNRADMVVFEHYEITEKGIIPFQQEFYKQGIAVTALDTKTIKELSLQDKISNLIWNKIYRRNLWEGLRFPEGYCYEDLFIQPQLFLRVHKAIYLQQKLYFNNRINPNSTTANRGGEFSAFNRYSKFKAYKEHERVAKIMQDVQAEHWSVLKAVNEAIKSFYINAQSERKLLAGEENDLKNYLQEHEAEALLSELSLKQKVLRWSVLHLSVICTWYGQIRGVQEKIKRKAHR